MNRIQTIIVVIFYTVTVILMLACDRQQTQEFRVEDLGFRPNILWITCEDITPSLGCYGDTVADTPNLDQLDREG